MRLVEKGNCMSRRKNGRRRKKKGMGKIIFLSILIVVCLIVLSGLVSGVFSTDKLTGGIKSAVTKKVTETVMEQAVQKALESSGNPQAAEKAKEIVGNMEESDKKEAEAIIGKYADSETISDCLEIMGDGVNSESINPSRRFRNICRRAFPKRISRSCRNCTRSMVG